MVNKSRLETTLKEKRCQQEQLERQDADIRRLMKEVGTDWPRNAACLQLEAEKSRSESLETRARQAEAALDLQSTALRPAPVVEELQKQRPMPRLNPVFHVSPPPGYSTPAGQLAARQQAVPAGAAGGQGDRPLTSTRIREALLQ